MFCEGELQLILPEHIIMAEKKHGVDTVSNKMALTILCKMLALGSTVNNSSPFFLHLSFTISKFKGFS